MESIKAPFLTYEDINAKSQETLVEYDWDGIIPVDVEAIVEFQVQMNIVPIRGLKDNYSIDGFLALDFEQIYVDEGILERHPTRYRFTLAHELGHMILHAKTFKIMEITDLSEWFEFYLSLDEHNYGWFERQAYWFAGALLIPEEPLVSEYKSMSDKLMSSGFTDNDLSQYSRTQLAGSLAKRFFVSTGVMQRRMEEVGIW